MRSTILDTIVASIRQRLPSRMRDVPVRMLEEKPLYANERLPFASSLRSDTLGIIAEIKRASPSAGVIRAAFKVAEIASSYEKHGAQAISVVTEPAFFQGDIEYLEIARSSTSLPLLRKDFIIDPYQVIEARSYGADAVLLIAAILDASHLADLQAAAAALGLTVLVEVHHERELDRIDLDRTPILGVNNRDLATFEVDIHRAARVFECVPDAIIRVAESGLRTGSDLAAIRRRGIDAVLIGETFMRSRDPGAALREMRTNGENILRRGE